MVSSLENRVRGVALMEFKLGIEPGPATSLTTEESLLLWSTLCTSSQQAKPTTRRFESEFMSPGEESFEESGVSETEDSGVNETEDRNEDDEACLKCGNHTPPESSVEDGDDEDVVRYRCDDAKLPMLVPCYLPF